VTLYNFNERFRGIDVTQIFLSYSRDDMEFKNMVKDALEEAGMIVWTDENLKPGTSEWIAAIEEQIETCVCMVVLLSPNSSSSRWVRRETMRALDRDKTIVPVLVHGEATMCTPLHLYDIQRLDLSVNYDSNIQRLVDHLLAHIDPDVDDQEEEINDEPDDEDPWVVVGEVAHYYKDLGAAGIALVDDVTVGDLVRFGDGEDAFDQRVFSIEKDGEVYESPGAGDEVGMLVDFEVQAGEVIYRATNAPWALEIGEVIDYDADASTVTIELTDDIRTGERIELREGNNYCWYDLALERNGRKVKSFRAGEQMEQNVEEPVAVGAKVFRVNK